MHQINYDLTLDEICKIEGDAGLEVKVRDGQVEDVKFKIQQYKRFYTQGMRGKSIMAVSQFVSRICGTCSNAHLLANIEAVEKALEIENTPQTDFMKKLMVNGLMIRDHALHLYIFALPDLFNVDSLVDFDTSDELQHQLLHDSLEVKSAGNKLQVYTAGRSVHAPFAAIGGFIKTPTESPDEHIENLKKIRPAVLRLIDIFLERLPELKTDTTYMAIRGHKAWSFLEGDIVTSDDKTIKEKDFLDHMEHTVVPYSHASAYKYKGKAFLTGSLARVNLNQDQLHSKTQEDAKKALAKFPSKNAYLNNVAQAIEILHCIDETIEMLQDVEWQKEDRVKPKKTSGVGVGVIEAPRGLLHYKLEIEDSKVKDGSVIVPTGLNQINIEKDIGTLIEQNIDLDKDKLEMKIERLIRAYDPCMSCASHFLKVNWDLK